MQDIKLAFEHFDYKQQHVLTKKASMFVGENSLLIGCAKELLQLLASFGVNLREQHLAPQLHRESRVVCLKCRLAALHKMCFNFFIVVSWKAMKKNKVLTLSLQAVGSVI